jgi:oligopeptide transport system substrate-binding protein
LTLEKNPAYYAASDVTIPRVNLWVRDESSAWEEYLAGLLDTASVPLALWDTARRDPELSAQLQWTAEAPKQITSWVNFYGFGTSEPPFDQLLVRKAFIASVDRHGLVALLQGVWPAWKEALTFTPPGSLGYVDGLAEGVGIDYDPAQARAWLAEAGYPNGKGLPSITLWFNGGGPYNQTVAEYAKQEWMDNLGVTVELRGVPWNEYTSDYLPSGVCQVWRYPWGMDFPEAYNALFWVVDGLRAAFGAWRDPAYEALMSQATREPDPDRRRALYRQAEKILVEEDAVMMPLFYMGDLIAAKPYLTRTYPFWGAPDLGDWDLTSAAPP